LNARYWQLREAFSTAVGHALAWEESRQRGAALDRSCNVADTAVVAALPLSLSARPKGKSDRWRHGARRDRLFVIGEVSGEARPRFRGQSLWANPIVRRALSRVIVWSPCDPSASGVRHRESSRHQDAVSRTRNRLAAAETRVPA
jgi:hypothetical protein